MGSLKILHPNLKEKNIVAVFHVRKPVPSLLDVVQKTSDPNHSPVGSPPIKKKRIRIFSNSLLASTAAAKSGSPLMYAEEKENVIEGPVSILKMTAARPRCASSTAASMTTRCSHQRRVQFNDQVLVQYIGDTDTSYEPLNTEHSDRQSFIARNALRRMQAQMHQPSFQVRKDSQSESSSSPVTSSTSSSASSMTPSSTQYASPSSHSADYQQAPPTTTTVTGSNNDPLHSKNVNISFSRTAGRNQTTTMKFVVFMGPQYDPANIVVKANMSGTRLRVVASLKPVREGSAGDQYNERFQLPMQVDPYKVEARLDARGFLTVTAPLLEPSSGSVSV